MMRFAHLTLAVWLVAAAGVCAGAPVDEQLLALRRAALAGDAQALIELGLKYENAEGVPKDQEAARRLYCGAARQGNAEARFRLGWAYANGRGGPRDDGMAAALFTLAAQQGHEHAARLLSYMSASGEARLPPCMHPDIQSASLADRVRKEAAAPRAYPASRIPGSVRQIVRRVAPRYAVDADLVLAVIAVESDFDPGALSPRKAQGLMQLIPETAARFGVRQPFDPVDNITGGVAYLRWLLAFFEGDVRLVLAAYNAGERAVERYRGIPPYAETREYVRKISALYPKITHPYEAGIVRPSAITTQPRAR